MRWSKKLGILIQRVFLKQKEFLKAIIYTSKNNNFVHLSLDNLFCCTLQSCTLKPERGRMYSDRLADSSFCSLAPTYCKYLHHCAQMNGEPVHIQYIWQRWMQAAYWISSTYISKDTPHLDQTQTRVFLFFKFVELLSNTSTHPLATAEVLLWYKNPWFCLI